METMNKTMSETVTRELVITRVFDVPRHLVYKAWTEQQRLEQWWGPKGLKLGVTRLDLRPGGLFHYVLHLPDGQKMWGRFVFSSLVEPERIVYISSFSDEAGGISRVPFSEAWPLEIHNTLTFTEQDGKTTLTQRSKPLHATAEERKTFEENIGSLQQGLAGTLDQLESYLASGSK
ncbi:SRPBCC domain-containing protein [Pontibacter roseus]|uniref:SRPBCC domain-containing protein n=1 Tax=Pontibacter roseus TaxID=336989 RepID=UPI0005256F08|nr:SRPBCC domain-containing protein [Pontibacter roseus]